MYCNVSRHARCRWRWLLLPCHGPPEPAAPPAPPRDQRAGRTAHLNAHGGVFTWGNNIWGQLGTGTLNGPAHCPTFMSEPPSERDACSKLPVPVGAATGRAPLSPCGRDRRDERQRSGLAVGRHRLDVGDQRLRKPRHRYQLRSAGVQALQQLRRRRMQRQAGPGGGTRREGRAQPHRRHRRGHGLRCRAAGRRHRVGLGVRCVRRPGPGRTRAGTVLRPVR
jgi:hypothetical protein